MDIKSHENVPSYYSRGKIRFIAKHIYVCVCVYVFCATRSKMNQTHRQLDEANSCGRFSRRWIILALYFVPPRRLMSGLLFRCSSQSQCRRAMSSRFVSYRWFVNMLFFLIAKNWMKNNHHVLFVLRLFFSQSLLYLKFSMWCSKAKCFFRIHKKKRVDFSFAIAKNLLIKDLNNLLCERTDGLPNNEVTE